MGRDYFGRTYWTRYLTYLSSVVIYFGVINFTNKKLNRLPLLIQDLMEKCIEEIGTGL